MFIAYTDVSGRPEPTDNENLVLAAVIINEREYQHIDNGIKRIKRTHFPNLADEHVEIHAKDMINRQGIFKEMPWNAIYAVLEDMFDFLADPHTHLSVIATLVRKNLLYKGVDPELWAHRLLFEGFDAFINKRNAQYSKEGRFSEYGIVIMDSEGSTKDQRLRNKLVDMIRHERWHEPKWIIEDPLFTNSKWRNLSQMADCVAYGIRKKYRPGNNPQSPHTKHWNKFFEQIEVKFDRPGGTYLNYGLKVFPKQ